MNPPIQKVDPRTGKKYGTRDWPARFWRKVNKDGPNGCWIWTGAKRHFGYGCVWYGRIEQAHRMSWMLEGNELPPPHLCLDHTCRNPPCVNPAHLRVVTYLQNCIENNSNPWAKNAAKTHCSVCNFPLSGENLALLPPRPKNRNKKTGKMVSSTRPGRICLNCYPGNWKHAVIPREKPASKRRSVPSTWTCANKEKI